MAEFTAAISAEVEGACRVGATEAGFALSRALGGKLDLNLVETGTWDAASPPSEMEGAGLAIMLRLDTAAALFVIPMTQGITPEWIKTPDPTGVSKLTTLAQELGMLLLPEEHMPIDFQAGYSDHLAAVVTRGEPTPAAGMIKLQITGEGVQPTPAYLVWPLTKGKAPLHSPDVAPPVAPPKPAPAAGPPRPAPAPDTNLSLEKLPTYARSLLRVPVTVAATLATKKLPVSNIVELVPGQIIQFNKSCEELLEIEANGLRIAAGECVKVGDKFGIRVTTMLLPEERFKKVGA